jgi:putative ABC transport system substrate-binding protein
VRRREFISLLGGAIAWPLAARAQNGVPVIGYFSSRTPDTEAALRTPFLKTLTGAGFVVGRDVLIEYRFSEGSHEKLQALATDLVRRPVSMLVATDRPAALAAKAATSTIPIVFTTGDDPVRIGLVKSLSSPRANATGVYLFTTQLGPKRLGLVRDILAKPGLIAFVVDSNNTASPQQVEEMQSAAKLLGQPLLVLRAGTERELDKVFSAMVEQKVSAVLYGATTFFQVVSARLIALAAQHKIPACYEWRDPVIEGGLMSYNTDRDEVGRQIGDYAAQILKGAKPSDLPVVQSSKFIFVINVTTAKTLGLSIPSALLARADELVE